MKFLGKYWKVLLAVALLVAAAMVYSNYQDEELAHNNEVNTLTTYNLTLQKKILNNQKYAGVQDQLKEATAQIKDSRLSLYEKFPVQMLEEDQLMYAMYLEKTFGTEITLSFSQAQPLTTLKDGATLKGLTLTVNYETTYEGFKDMINYLATDSCITSVQFASIQYDAARDMAVGTITLTIYLIDTNLRDYESPEFNTPETGKENVFD